MPIASSIFRVFQSTPPVKAATRFFRVRIVGYTISIHAAREGGDVSGYRYERSGDISIHAAREGGDTAYRGCR